MPFTDVMDCIYVLHDGNMLRLKSYLCNRISWKCAFTVLSFARKENDPYGFYLLKKTVVIKKFQQKLEAAVVQWPWSRTRGRRVTGSSPGATETLPCRRIKSVELKALPLARKKKELTGRPCHLTDSQNSPRVACDINKIFTHSNKN
ncbi:hypothetical protein TNCV_4358391 [Trichonephila clavipes]|nr:hypothetical protein TNCV_4358391 [Trichonephila clavipes]